jgi:ribosome maturation factor RimP
VIVEHITALLAEKFEEEDFRDCFLIEAKHHGAKLEVYVDSDIGITFDKCQKISRYLERYLDEESLLGDDYVLEVSSPGVNRPLRFWRQYPKHVGRKVEVSLASGEVKNGVLIAIDEHAITVEEEVKRKEGKKNIKEIVRTSIPFAEVVGTKVKVSF